MRLKWSAIAALACGLAGGCARVQDADCVTLACVGDVMLGRDVKRMCAQRGDEYPFEALGDLLAAPDITFGNLEGPLADGRTRYPRVNALFAPPRMAIVLERVGFDVMGLANNHAIDCGRPGLLRTIEALQQAGITPVGAGRDATETEAGAVVCAKGLRIGFLAYSNFPYTDFVHDPDRASILMLNEENLRRTVPRLRSDCDALVVSFHWGKEGIAETSPYERRLGHLAIDLGADLVVGHHAHVRGELERYHRGLIAYCLGNLVFDDNSYGGNEGYILTCRLTHDGLTGYETVPVRVTSCQGRLAGGR